MKNTPRLIVDLTVFPHKTLYITDTDPIPSGSLIGEQVAKMLERTEPIEVVEESGKVYLKGNTVLETAIINQDAWNKFVSEHTSNLLTVDENKEKLDQLEATMIRVIDKLGMDTLLSEETRSRAIDYLILSLDDLRLESQRLKEHAADPSYATDLNDLRQTMENNVDLISWGNEISPYFA
jgi:hypothetical protein